MRAWCAQHTHAHKYLTAVFFNLLHNVDGRGDKKMGKKSDQQKRERKNMQFVFFGVFVLFPSGWHSSWKPPIAKARTQSVATEKVDFSTWHVLYRGSGLSAWFMGCSTPKDGWFRLCALVCVCVLLGCTLFFPFSFFWHWFCALFRCCSRFLVPLFVYHVRAFVCVCVYASVFVIYASAATF